MGLWGSEQGLEAPCLLPLKKESFLSWENLNLVLRKKNKLWFHGVHPAPQMPLMTDKSEQI